METLPSEMSATKEEFEPLLDDGIWLAVSLLRKAGIETYESCEGGVGHAYAEPTIRFHGDRSEGFKALAMALQCGLPVIRLTRMWSIIDGEPTGPYWAMVFMDEIEAEATP